MAQKTHFADRLIAAIQKKGTPICVGLDPRLENIPAHITAKAMKEKGKTFEAAAQAILEFNKGIIDAVHDVVPAVKPQFAFYAPYGFAGVWAFEETCKYAHEQGLVVIADAKVNDIGSTAEAYANAFLGKVGLFGAETDAPFVCDALTVNPYLGTDGVKPFIDVCKKQGSGIFILVKTSNPSSGDLQDQIVCEQKLPAYELMGHFVDSWGADEIGKSGYSSIGAVVGATYPSQAAALRKLMPQTVFLVPGYGAQGGGAEDVKPCFNSDGLGAIVNSSRGIIFAWEKEGDEKKFAEAARNAVEDMKQDLYAI
ncbi:orotidine-5'-phosphate decarboxylase [Candidatus Peregrinibacteria bacterium CG11_big_fil_rev_8_21_14_0_20_46_8]|nr:MAG: orotidine-5'-phosphate decarboxylase [Candidatus Peregrinibacteria bacterium CG11_big_fil_rev_8_21_14_0_20_46_8]